MRTLSIKLSTLASTGTMLLAVSAAFAADNLPLTASTPGAKIDSGLGDLPHYRYWADPTGKNPAGQAQQVAGQKLDSGLGDLPHYRYWADPTGKAPVAPTVVVAGTAPR